MPGFSLLDLIVVVLFGSIVLLSVARVILSGLSGEVKPHSSPEISDEEAEAWANFDPSKE